MPVRPTLAFVLRHPAHLLAFGLGSGLVRPAPGTAGTLLALPIFWFVHPRVPDAAFLGMIAVLFLVGIWACGRTGRTLGVPDHSGMVLDEIVAFLLVLFMLPATPAWQAVGFLLFRLFDIYKPPPIRQLDRSLKGGLGVMLDDLVAAFYALLAVALWKTVVVHGG
jgi:phosphatidylglycerophosphatase A